MNMMQISNASNIHYYSQDLDLYTVYTEDIIDPNFQKPSLMLLFLCIDILITQDTSSFS